MINNESAVDAYLATVTNKSDGVSGRLQCWSAQFRGQTIDSITPVSTGLSPKISFPQGQACPSMASIFLTPESKGFTRCRHSTMTHMECSCDECDDSTSTDIPY